ncbi:NUDIX domain-containing protein [Novosphingobium terrae]|uniref:NUDIX domain-containing protein n=1 Tax=Novosphingobium terrae TaxID=2726189 RepID=UPI0019820FE6|nr:NUDIX domain-containing protein [Novosphingobium terrae]
MIVDEIVKFVSKLGNGYILLSDKIRKIFGIKKRVVQAIVVDCAGNIFIVHHRYRKGWHLPGGNFSGSEHPRKAIMRELKEEIGLSEFEKCGFVARFDETWNGVEMDFWLFYVSAAKVAWKPSLEIDRVEKVNPLNMPVDAPVAKMRCSLFYKKRAGLELFASAE